MSSSPATVAPPPAEAETETQAPTAPPAPAQAPAPTKTDPKRKTDPDTDQKPRRQPPYHVVLLNDDDHTFEYVIAMMRRLFGFSVARGMKIACDVHIHGKAVILTTTREHAELKQEQIHAYGPDYAIASCQGSMTAIIQPAENEGK